MKCNKAKKHTKTSWVLLLERKSGINVLLNSDLSSFFSLLQQITKIHSLKWKKSIFSWYEGHKFEINFTKLKISVLAICAPNGPEEVSSSLCFRLSLFLLITILGYLIYSYINPVE